MKNQAIVRHLSDLRTEVKELKARLAAVEAGRKA
jgi:hypothetical protein